MCIFKEALAFENAKISNMTRSDRVVASSEAKRLILNINEIYKETKDAVDGYYEAYYCKEKKN